MPTYTPEEFLGPSKPVTPPVPGASTVGASVKRTRGEAMSIVRQFETAEGGPLPKAKRLEMVTDLMNGATFELAGSTETPGFGGGGSAPAPAEVIDPVPATTGKTFTPEEFMGPGTAAAVAPTGPPSMGVKDFAREFSLGFLGIDTPDKKRDPYYQPAMDAAGATWDLFKKRFMEGKGPAADEETARITAAKAEQALPPEQQWAGVLGNLNNPVASIINDSLPANFIEWVASRPEAERKKFSEARQVLMQSNIIANPQQFPDVAVQAALRAKSAREAKLDPTIRQQWDALATAAKADPGKMGAMFANAIIADPYMLVAPIGIGARPVQGTIEMAKGAQTTSKVAAAADRVIDAAGTGAALNVAVTGAQQASEGRNDPTELEFAAAMGGAISGPLGLLFKGKAPTNIDPSLKAKLDAAIDATLDGKADTVPDVTVTPAQAKDLQTQLRERLGIKTDEEVAAWQKERRKQARGAFKDDAEYADYLAERERLALNEAALPGQYAEAARAKLDATPGAEVPTPQTSPRGVVTPEVQQALDTVPFLRTPEQRVALRAAGMLDDAGPSAPDNAEVIAALRKPGFQRTAAEKVAIEKSVLGRSGYKPGQSGQIDQKLLARGATVGAGATLGYALSDKDLKTEGAILGGLAGFLLPAGGTVLSKLRQSGAVTPDGFMNLRRADFDEAGVIARVKTGDQLAVKQLYEEYVPRLIRQLTPMLKRARGATGREAEDVAQEAFFTAYQKLDQFKGDSSFGTWLFMIAKNKGFREIENSARQPKTETIFAKEVGDSEGGGARTLAQGAIVKDNAGGLLRPDVEMKAASLDTPESLLEAGQAEAKMQAAIDKLSENQRQVVMMKLVDGLSDAEVAAKLGVSEANVRKLLSRAREKLETAIASEFGAKPASRVPKGQRGEVDPRLLKAGAVAGIGAGVGALLDPEDWESAAPMGAGLALAAASVRKPAFKAMDYGLGVVSTRIKNISPELHHRAITLERKMMENTQAALDKVHPFLDKLNRLPADVKGILERAILTNDPNVTNNLLRELGDAGMIKDWQAVRSVLDSFRDKLMEMGRFKSGVSEYFPRVVKDYEGLIKALGTKYGDQVNKAVEDANSAALANSGRELSDIEKSIIINRELQAIHKASGQAGFAKRRTVEDISEELQKYYATPTESLNSYIRAAVQDIETAKFFGKDLKNVVKEGKTWTNVDQSIGNVVRRLREAGKITSEQEAELSSILKSRFTGGMKGSNEIIQTAKNLGNAGLLGNALSAVTQFGDTIIQAYLQDISSAVEASLRTIAGKKKVSMESFGLATHIAEEFVSTTKSAEFLNTMFKYGLFSAVDRFGKNVALNAAIIRHQRLAKTPKGIAELQKKYGDALGDEFPELVRDLKSGEMTDAVRGLAFAELSRSQPITRLELPQGYLDNPNGRTLYWLKTFMIKQMDVARRDGLNEMKKGNYVKGARNLLELGVALGIAGATTTQVKDFLKDTAGKVIAGRPGDIDPSILLQFEASDIPMNMLKTFGWSEFTKQTATGGEKGKAQPIKAVLDQATPPYKMFEEIIRRDPKAVRYIPILGAFFAPYVKTKQEEAKERGMKSSRSERERRRRAKARREARGEE